MIFSNKKSTNSLVFVLCTFKHFCTCITVFKPCALFCSQEEIRSRLPKYRPLKHSTSLHMSSLGGVPPGPPQSSMQNLPMPPIVRPGMPPMGMPMHGMIPGDVVRPGMGPPPMGQALPRSPFAPPMVAGQRPPPPGPPPMQGHSSPSFV